MRRIRVAMAAFLVGAMICVPLTGWFTGNGPATARADSVLSVYPATIVTGTTTVMTVTVTLPPTLVSASYTIDVGFDLQDTVSTAMYVPSSIPLSSISVNGQPVSVYYAGVSGHDVLLNGVMLAPSGTLQVSFGSAFGLRTLVDGTHSITVSVKSGSTVVASFSGTYQSTGATASGALSLQAITMDSMQLGAAVPLGFDFVAGSTLYPLDQIMIQFPAGFTVPASIPVTAAGMIETALGKYVNSFGVSGVSISGSLVTLTIPQPDATVGNNASYFDANLVIGVRFGITAGFRLPTTAGAYTFKMWTSRQTTPVTKTITFGTGITSAQITAAPLVSGAAMTLTGGFVTSSSGAMTTGSGSILLSFPSTFALPSSVPGSAATVNGQPATVSVSGHVLRLAVPSSIAALSSVSFFISVNAGLVMPAAVSGGYVISLSTSSDGIPMPCAAIIPATSTVTNISINDSPAVHGVPAALTAVFSTGAGGTLSAGDTISLSLPYGFVVPSAMTASQVMIKSPATASSGISPATVTCSPSTQSIVLALPSAASIAGGSTIAVSLPAVITNPAAGGSFTAKVSTSRETTAVESQPFTIYANPVSTLKVTPASPDGRNGVYVTQPSFTISVDGPSGVTLTAFYKIDNAASFTSYNLTGTPSITVPQGIHTVTSYAQDSLGNVEPVHTQQFTVDLTDPVITVSSPAQKAVVVQATTAVTGKVACLDPSSAQLTVNGQTVAVAADGSFNASVSFSHEGDNTITLVATSASGRTKTMTLTVDYIARVTMSLAIGSTTVNMNNEFTTIEAAPYISKKGVTMVPLRFISEAFKATVAWDPVFKAVTIDLNGKAMRIQVGYLSADVNGKSFALQDAPAVVKGRTFVPLRFIAENFGARVDWNAALKTVNIVYPKP